jgi:hypothetical protein
MEASMDGETLFSGPQGTGGGRGRAGRAFATSGCGALSLDVIVDGCVRYFEISAAVKPKYCALVP